ncbi:MAG: hypothetical protein GY947_19975 [Rhodobacteraceae bacterium]|nr:hypothetical protein [Paracoccaceae bacterium]
MIEIVILGRGGQGAQTAGNQLARAFFERGFYVQSFSTYGGARRGTPVTSSLRADTRPIRLRCNITKATGLLCFDDSLLDDGFLSLAADDALVVVNSAQSAAALSKPGRPPVIPVDGRAIAHRNNMGKIVNAALLGGFAAALRQPDIDTLCGVIEATAPAKTAENIASCREAFGLISGQVERV